MKNFKCCLAITLLAIFFSCENQNLSNFPDKGMTLDLSEIEFNIDFTSQFDLNEVTLDYVIGIVSEELFSEDFTNQLNVNDANASTEFAEGFDLNIKNNLVTVRPLLNTSKIQGDEITDWTFNGICQNESCIKEEISTITKDVIKGQEFDIRIKRDRNQASIRSTAN